MVIHPALVGYQPQRAFEFITQFLGIPRPSKGENQVVRLIQGWAMCHGWRTHIDTVGNISVHVPAAPGYEKAPAICMQAHVDMVYVPKIADLLQHPDEVDLWTELKRRAEHWSAESTNLAQHVLAALLAEKVRQRGPIDVEVVDGILRSKGQKCTIGMDNIAGVTKAMYLAENAKMHGPLELLFTVDEEGDFSGVEGWDPAEHGMVSRLLMNLDTPVFRRIGVRSGGVQYVLATLNPEREEVSGGVCYNISLSGYVGGHNADHVHLNRGNALKDLGDLLAILPEGARIVEISGGDAGNSLPAVATAVVWLPEAMSSNLQASLGQHVELISQRLNHDVTLTIGQEDASSKLLPLTSDETMKVVALMRVVASQVVKMSEFSPEDAAALSTTFSLLSTTTEGALEFKSIARGSDETAMMSLARNVEKTYVSCGCTTKLGHFMHSWVQEPGSSLVQSALAAYEALGIPAELREFHCALELRTLIERNGVQRFDAAVSIGSQVNNEHAVTEEMDLESFRLTILVAMDILARVATDGHEVVTDRWGRIPPG